MEPITVTGERCRNWRESSELEWLETNGTGGFAMGTVSGANTRRYHGLLTVSLRPPVERYVLLSRVEEEVLCDGESASLGACQYPGTITPSGFQFLDEFRLDPFPAWNYRTRCALVGKKLFLMRNKQQMVLRYRVSERCRLRVRPFLAYRDYHSTQSANDAWNRGYDVRGDMVRFQPYGQLPPLFLHHNAAGFVPVSHWYHNVEYREEMERGLNFREDLYSPGWLDFELMPNQDAYIVAAAEDLGALDTATLEQWEAAERELRGTVPDSRSALRERLEAAADQFIVHRTDGTPTIIAGYPWFTDWGRDTMISLPGLLISRGRLDDARAIISGFLKHLNKGLIPNRFTDAGEEPEYNNADGTLWMFPAVWSYQLAGGDDEFVRDVFYPKAREILDWHERGTHYDIKVDPADGLLSAGGPGTQLTWMDAKVGDWVVTPRHGKPVEINALWYNALRMTAWWASRFGDYAYSDQLTAKAQRMARNFEEAFWNQERGCLFDRIAPEGPDSRLRPNQLFAMSLPFPLLNSDRRRSILQVVEDRLLTPVGLRTLEPGHPEYRGRYEGGPLERDGAYHQGTVWPWLLGPYVSARLQAFGETPDNLAYCRRVLERLEPELERGCLGSLAELYDADPPHRPTGAMAQAWSVAESLRVLLMPV